MNEAAVALWEEPVLIDPEIVAQAETRESAVEELQQSVYEFMKLERGRIREEELYHRMLAIVHQICAAILRCEHAQLERAEMLPILEPVRRVHARSPFVNRLQSWPRGYPGDFETVEYLVRGENHAEDPVARSCEAYALSRAIAQQHRNKVQHQAARILQTMIANPGATRIVSIACGSCPDLRALLPQLPTLAGEIWLNDLDHGAIEFSRAALRPIESKCRFREADAISYARRLPRDAFDLVLAGGLFDYLDERSATLLIRIAYMALAPGGTFFFTNIAAGNPYRPLIEYFGDWKLKERTAEEMIAFCEAAGISRSNVSIRREETGLALLIEVTKLE
jgi:SAM-dependent methyltransferase